MLVQVTLVPLATVILAGEKAKFWIVIALVVVVGAGVVVTGAVDVAAGVVVCVDGAVVAAGLDERFLKYQ